MTALFITATGTDIGKTHVACGLIQALRARGRAVEALKPIASGFDPVHAAQSDPGRLLAASGLPATIDAIGRIAPWRFAAPLSPDMAAQREGRRIPMADVVDFCRRDADAGSLRLVEGVGGVMVPLDDRTTVLDWMAVLGWPTILVTGSYLGTLSHTFTAIDVMARRAIDIATIVINESETATVPLDDTLDSLRRFAPNIPIVVVRRNRDGGTSDPAFAALAATLDAKEPAPDRTSR